MPLHVAAANGQTEAAHLLLSGGALPTALNGTGQTALQVAANDKVGMLLRRADAGDPHRLHPGADVEGEEGEEDDEESERKGDGSVGVSPAGRGNGGSGRSANARGGTGGGRRLFEDVEPPAESMEMPPPCAPPPRARALPSGWATAAVRPPRATARARAADPSESNGDALDTDELLRELQRMLNSREADVKALLMRPHGLSREVQCDIERVGSSSNYRCYIRLGGQSARRVCIFEASRSRKGKLANSHYRLQLPEKDPRLAPKGAHRMEEYAARARPPHIRWRRHSS